MFYGREKELELLRTQLASSQRTAVLVYGKRRVGKSTLIEQAARSFDGVVVNHLCTQSSFEGNLALLCRSVSQALGTPAFTMQTLFDLFDYLESLGKPVLLVLDEYQYFKESLKKGELDSYLQVAIDRLPPQVKLVLCGSYITVMKELLDQDNPLFGRFTAIIHLRDMDYWDAQHFYPALPVHDKIARYAVLGGSPYVLSSVDHDEPLEAIVKQSLIAPNSILRTHIENVMLAEIRKSFDMRILQILGNGKKRHSDIASKLGGDRSGLLSKQLAHLIDMETIAKTSPINRTDDKKKTFYSIKDNLMRFFFCYLFANDSALNLIGEDAFFETSIEPSLHTFVSLRFEDIAMQYFSRMAKAGKLPGIENMGSYWYDDKERHENGQFDCVLQRSGAYAFYEVKYYRSPMGLQECEDEERQVRRIAPATSTSIGFVCSAGFDFESERYRLITGEDVYSLRLPC